VLLNKEVDRTFSLSPLGMKIGVQAVLNIYINTWT